MWQMLVGCDVNIPVTVDSVKEMLPNGYSVVDGDRGQFTIYDDRAARQVAICLVMSDGLLWGFDEANVLGLSLAMEMGKKYPQVNPAAVLNGFVYKVDEVRNLYRLEVLPFSRFRDAIDGAKQEVAAGRAYFVTFLRGDWHKNSLKVISKMKLWVTGELDFDTGSEVLHLI